jgi:hypothetical protein
MKKFGLALRDGRMRYDKIDETNIMTPIPLPLGTRVRVRRDPIFGPGPWPAEPTGTIIEAPDDSPLYSHGTPFTWAETVRGPELQYWIAFDEPQVDADGDGPYARSQVSAKYLEAFV